jgi:arsenite/tail-anchored protein-transporting ATPase
MDGFLERLPELVIVVGKGGVGKTTCAIGVASALAASGQPTLLVSTDPAGSLGPVLGTTLAGGVARRIEAVPRLAAMQLEPAVTRKEFLARWRDVIVTIVDRGTYLDVEDVGGLVDASFPGADEIFGLLVLAQLLAGSGAKDAKDRWKRFVIDTAPTGHTLRLLTLPDTFDAMISLLDAMQAKHRFMVRALTRRYRRDEADEFLEEMRRTIGGLRASLGDPARAGAVLVTRNEPVVLSETVRYAEALRRLGISIAAVVMDGTPAVAAGELDAAISKLEEVAGTAALFALPLVDPPPEGLEGVRKAFSRLHRLRGAGARGKKVVRTERKGLQRRGRSGLPLESGGDPEAGRRATRKQRGVVDLLRTLTIVGGKGGVGKTTVSCALALVAIADEGHRADTLLVSTDPAPSIADALGISTPDWATRGVETLEGSPGLHIWQMDAVSAFQELRDRYRDRIDALFDAFMGQSGDMVHDRAILRDLLALAPPGIDELYALASLGDALEEGRYARIIVDPAPTGHLLRLLELPTLAIEWSHRLMRLLVKYKDIGGLGDAAQDLVNFSRRTRALDRLLHNEAGAGVVLVSLDEPVVIAETKRLAGALQSTRVGILGVVRNRVKPEAMDSMGAQEIGLWRGQLMLPTFAAPAYERPLVGAAAIRDWCERWRQRD